MIDDDDVDYENEYSFLGNKEQNDAASKDLEKLVKKFGEDLKKVGEKHAIVGWYDTACRECIWEFIGEEVAKAFK